MLHIRMQQVPIHVYNLYKECRPNCTSLDFLISADHDQWSETSDTVLLHFNKVDRIIRLIEWAESILGRIIRNPLNGGVPDYCLDCGID